jgi:hypothetical protein
MKTKRILKNTLLVLFTITAFVSCDNFEEELEVLTDVYAINKKLNNEVKTATAYYAYANQSLLGTSVTIPNNGGVVTLEGFSSSIYTLAREPKDSDYKTTTPAEGSYVFNIQGGKGETLQVPDILNYDGLDLPEFTKTKFSGTPFILELEWIDIAEADGYVVKMFDLDGKLIFNGYSVGQDVNKYTVTGTSNSGYWTKSAVDGESYLLQLSAFSYDAEANVSNYVYNISEISLGEVQIKWGVN